MTYRYVPAEDAIRGMDPQWDRIGNNPINEWRAQIPEDVQKIWPTFSLEQRKAIVEWAESLAQREDIE
jgi:hypothetical protein